MVDSHESDAFGPYFEKVHFLNIQNKQRLYIMVEKQCCTNVRPALPSLKAFRQPCRH